MGIDDVNPPLPAISVGLPVYNGERYLQGAIDSVLAQGDPDFELILCDNASTDATAEICRRAAESDHRVRHERNPDNIGAARNYNRCFALARAPLFRWMNADDLIEPTLHERCRAALADNPQAVLAYGKTRLIDAAGTITGDYDDGLDLRQPTPSARFRAFFERVGLTNAIYGLMRTDALARTGLMGDGRQPAADVRLMAELTLLGRFVEIPEPLFRRRIHEEASSADRGDDARQAKFWRGNSGGRAFRLPQWRSHLGYLRSAATLPDGYAERLRVAAFSLRRMYWARAELARELGVRRAG